jgi:hypothetical protein
MAAALFGAPAAATAARAEAYAPGAPPRVSAVVPGVTYERLEGGGQVAHVLRVRATPRLSLAPVLAGGSPQARGALTEAVRARRTAGAVAAINGDFFSFAQGYPSGLFLAGGELVNEPEAGRSSLLLDAASALAVTRLGFAGTYQAEGFDPVTGAPLRPRTLSGLNRPAERGAEAILYTPAFGSATTPRGGSRFEVRVRLDQDGPLQPNAPRAGQVVARAGGGGMTIGAGHAAISGVGSAGATISGDLPLGRRVVVTGGVTGLPAGAVAGIGGGPLLVLDGAPVRSSGELFTFSQIASRTSRSAVGQAADGTRLLVVSEGPSQGRVGVTSAEHADLMASLGAQVAVGMDGGGSAQLAVRDELVIPWDDPRRIASALVVGYDGVQLDPPPERISPNGDRVRDTITAIVRVNSAGATRLILTRRGRPFPLLDQARAPGGVAVRVDPRALGAPDGVYQLVATHAPADGASPSVQRRRVVIDRTLAGLAPRPAGSRRRPVLRVRFRLLRPARVTARVRSASGRTLATLASGRRLGPGRRTLVWGRRAGGRLVSGRVAVEVEARTTRLGRTGLRREVTLRPARRP